MNVLAHSAWRTLGGVVLLVLVAAGCRTYGGYGTEAELLDQIERANERAAEALERARGDLALLERAAASNDALGPFAEAYAAVVEVQEALLNEHRELAVIAADNRGDYRVLNRIYGAIISDQQIIRDRYDGLLVGLERALNVSVPEPIPPLGRYQVAPQFYQRIAYRGEPASLADLLNAAAAAPAAGAPADEAAPAEGN